VPPTYWQTTLSGEHCDTVSLSSMTRSHQCLASIAQIAVVVLTKSNSSWIVPFDMFNFDRQFQLKTIFFFSWSNPALKKSKKTMAMRGVDFKWCVSPLSSLRP